MTDDWHTQNQSNYRKRTVERVPSIHGPLRTWHLAGRVKFERHRMTIQRCAEVDLQVDLATLCLCNV